MSDSYITTRHGKAVAYVGPDAVRLFQAIAIRGGISMYAKTGMRPSRNWTPTAMLQTAGQICGKTYKRGQYDLAIADLTVWIEAMKLAMPVEKGD